MKAALIAGSTEKNVKKDQELAKLQAEKTKLQQQLYIGLGGTGNAAHIRNLQDSIFILITERNNLQLEL